MSDLEIATMHRASLADLGWQVTELRTVDGAPGFEVTQPGRTEGRGRRARTIPAQRQVRSFDRGTMIVTVIS
jgi:hypothetical protein